jgi:hypothetical protein
MSESRRSFDLRFFIDGDKIDFCLGVKTRGGGDA